MKKVLVLLLLIVSTNVLAFSLFGPKNFDECVLEYMKGVSSDDASHIIVRTCRRKFSENEINNVQKNIDECILENMKGVNSDDASHIIVRTCRRKFSEK